jgi:hypothetical protein
VVDSTTIVLADAGDIFTAQIRTDDDQLVECTGEIAPSCNGNLNCSADFVFENDAGDEVTMTATEAYTLAFDDSSLTGTANISASAAGAGSCSGKNSVTGRK